MRKMTKGDRWYGGVFNLMLFMAVSMGLLTTSSPVEADVTHINSNSTYYTPQGTVTVRSHATIRTRPYRGLGHAARFHGSLRSTARHSGHALVHRGSREQYRLGKSWYETPSRPMKMQPRFDQVLCNSYEEFCNSMELPGLWKDKVYVDDGPMQWARIEAKRKRDDERARAREYRRRYGRDPK